MPDNAQQYLDPQVLAKLQGLSLRARLIVEGYVAGQHRSPYNGFSVEFAEHREYSPGDDLRYLDWKVLGRTDKYYLKQYEEETNLVCYLVLDCSESMGYRGPNASLSKLEYAQSAAAALAYLILHQQDGVGLATFDSEMRAIVRPARNAGHMKEILHVLDRAKPAGQTGAAQVFHSLAERFNKRGVVVVLSDMLADVDALLKGLKHFRHRRHEVVLMHVLDPAELDFPFQQTTLFRGLEGLPEVLTEPRALRKAYLDELGRFLRRLKQGCREQRIDYVSLRTDQSLAVVLSSYLASRS